MKGQELKILFKDDMAFLTEEVALDFNQVHISNSRKMCNRRLCPFVIKFIGD